MQHLLYSSQVLSLLLTFTGECNKICWRGKTPTTSLKSALFRLQTYPLYYLMVWYVIYMHVYAYMYTARIKGSEMHFPRQRPTCIKIVRIYDILLNVIIKYWL